MGAESAEFPRGRIRRRYIAANTTHLWQNMERAHYPWARENVERIKEEIARQAEIQQMQQQIQGLSEEVNGRKGYEEYLLSKMQENLSGGTENGKQ